MNILTHDDCDCPAYRPPEVHCERIDKKLWMSEMPDLPFSFGYGPTKRAAKEDILGFYESAICCLN